MVWMIISIAILIIVLLVVAIIFRDKNHKTDYHSFFIMGIIWVGAGIPLMISANSPGLFILGLIFMVVGLIHHKKWKKNIKDRKDQWKKMSKKDKKKFKTLRWAMFILLLLGVVVLAVTYFVAKGV